MIGRIHVYHFLIWCLRNARCLANMMNITVYSQSWCCNFQPNPWHVVLTIWKSTFNFRTTLIMTPQWDSFSKSCIILFTKRPKKCEVPLVPRWGGGSSCLFSISLPQRPNNWGVSEIQWRWWRLKFEVFLADVFRHVHCRTGHSTRWPEIMWTLFMSTASLATHRQIPLDLQSFTQFTTACLGQPVFMLYTGWKGT